MFNNYTKNRNEFIEKIDDEAVEFIKSFYPLTFLRRIYLTFNIFSSKNLISHAASSAFYFLLSVVPLGLFFVYVFDSWLTEYGKISDYFFSLLSQINPEMNKEFFINMGFLKGGSYLYGVAGIAGLLWSSRHVFKGMRSAFNVIFNENRRTGVIKNSLISFIFLPVIFIAVIVFFTGSVLINQLKKIVAYFDIQLSADSFILNSINSFYTIFIAVVIIYLIYRYMAGVKIRNAYALVAAILFTVTVILVQKLLGFFIYAGKYYILYSVISAVIIALLWSYVVFSLLYFYGVFVYVQSHYLELEFIKWYLSVNTKSFFVERILFSNPSSVLNKYRVVFNKGEYIFRDNDAGGYMYILLSGGVCLYKDGKFLSDIPVNSFFGVSGVVDKCIYDSDAVCQLSGYGLKLPVEFYNNITDFSTEISKNLLSSVVRHG